MTIVSLIPFTLLVITACVITRPITIALTIVAMCMFVCINMSMTSIWSGLMVFLVYIGGIIVAFIYFCALSPVTKISEPTWIVLALISPLVAVFSTNTYKPVGMYSHYNTPTITYIESVSFVLTLAVLLFTIIILVVKLVISSDGPLRSLKIYS
jgi:hypothetical protein